MGKRHKPEEIIGKLREAEIVLAQGGTTVDACRRIALVEQTYYRWRREYGGLKRGSASNAGPRPFLPQVIGTKQLSQIDWEFRPTLISTTLAAFDTAFEYLSMTRRGPALDADPQ